MDKDKGGHPSFGVARLFFVLGMVLILTSILLAVVFAVGGSDLTDARDDLALWAFALAGIFCLVCWWRERSRVSEISDELESERRERERLEERADRFERESREERDRAKKNLSLIHI